MTELSREELMRYDRQMILPGFGKEKQSLLKNAKVLVVGAGGLGCPVLSYLAAAGVGTIGIIDFDKIEISNLHRQFLYTHDDVGKQKSTIAAAKIMAQNKFITVNDHAELLSESNAHELISNYCIVVDGSDNFLTRYLVNDTCVNIGKPLVYGSILRNEGQVAVFNFKGSKNLRDLFSEAPNPEDVPSCAEAGVVGALAGITGSIMASHTIKVILNDHVPVNELLLFNTNNNSWKNVKF
jgi:molybdopterin/thiamine biosynthesis adenylyltransferase